MIQLVSIEDNAFVFPLQSENTRYYLNRLHQIAIPVGQL